MTCPDCGCEFPRRSGSGRQKTYCEPCGIIRHRRAQAVASLRGYHRRRAQTADVRAARTPRVGRFCGLCMSQPWRVAGEVCKACGLAHGPEYVLVPSGMRSTWTWM